MGQAQPPRRASLGHRAIAATRHAWSRYWTCRAARATVGILRALDDRALNDIGVDRAEIAAVVLGDCARQRQACRCGPE